MEQQVRKMEVHRSQSAAWGGMVDLYWNHNYSKRHRYRTISKAIQELISICDKDWNMRHTDHMNRTTIYFRDVTDAVSFSFCYS